jgi:hypothetical protein
LQKREILLDQALAHIWKETCCSAVRLNLYHIKNEENGQLKADPEIKQILKKRLFKWKTVQNDQETGTRSEILEVQNPDGDTAKSKAELTSSATSLGGRRLAKEPMTLYFSTMVAFGKEKNTTEESSAPQV